jgi:hypothetical protein
VQQFNRNFKPERENKKEKGCWYIGVNFNPPVEETITVTPFMIEAGTGVELKCFKKMENSEPRFVSLHSIAIQHVAVVLNLLRAYAKRVLQSCGEGSKRSEVEQDSGTKKRRNSARVRRKIR